MEKDWREGKVRRVENLGNDGGVHGDRRRESPKGTGKGERNRSLKGEL
jgi:hypothetical protein